MLGVTIITLDNQILGYFAKHGTGDISRLNYAKRLFMDAPDKALAMTLKGPAQDQQAYTEAFNQVFGA